MSTKYVDCNRNMDKIQSDLDSQNYLDDFTHDIAIVLKISNVMCPLGRPGSSKVLVRTFSPTLNVVKILIYTTK